MWRPLIDVETLKEGHACAPGRCQQITELGVILNIVDSTCCPRLQERLLLERLNITSKRSADTQGFRD